MHSYSQLAQVYSKQGEYLQAEQVLNQGLNLSPRNHFLLGQLIGTLTNLGKSEQAITRFQQFVQQPGYRFGRQSQVIANRYLVCCKKTRNKTAASWLYKHYGRELDQCNEDLFFAIYQQN